ncbi:MAG: hypothetical protein SFV54_06200 [Bryobacteraceae bacterium]|nr:hypothetical protein [Bryobacteraceae bacterium]
MSLQLSGRRLSGVLGSRMLSVGVDTSGATGLKPGSYRIHKPYRDPAQGLVAVVTWLDPGAENSVVGKKVKIGAGFMDFEGIKGMDYEGIKFLPGNSSSFLLTGRPIPGRSCIVVTEGIGELMGDLERSQGALLRVS